MRHLSQSGTIGSHRVSGRLPRRLFGLAGRPGFRRLAAVTVLLGLTLATPAIPQATNPIAQAVGVRPAATGQLGGTEVTLVAGAALYEGQVIATNASGEVQIVFADDTRMVIGPNSILVIESILMRNQNTVSNFAVNALGGTFRFITGNSPSETYTINTPTGTIGVFVADAGVVVPRPTFTLPAPALTVTRGARLGKGL